MVTSKRIVFERILCPIDLTPESNEALRYAVVLARCFSAKLFVCHCIEDATADGQPRANGYREKIVQAVQSRMANDTSAPIEWKEVLTSGTPPAGIRAVSENLAIDLIVMHSGRTSFTSELGSTAESLSRSAPCPVLVTHTEDKPLISDSEDEIRLKRVVAAYDFSADSELALVYGLSLAQEYQAELHVLHVLPPTPRSEVPELAGLPSTDELAFQKVVSRLWRSVPTDANYWCEVKQAVRIGSPYREILAYAEEYGADIICMGRCGSGFGPKALFGSNSDRVLRQASCPVLIARPTGHGLNL